MSSASDARPAVLETVALTVARVRTHLPTLLQIDADTIGEPWLAEHWLADAPDKWQLSRVVLADGRAVAFLVASRKPGALHVHRVAVDAGVRRRGVAEALIRALADDARRTGTATLSLKVHASNAPARALYARLGFQPLDSAGDTLHLVTTVADILAAPAHDSSHRASAASHRASAASHLPSAPTSR